MGVKTREHLTGGAVRPPVASAETAKCVAVITSHRWRSMPHVTPFHRGCDVSSAYRHASPIATSHSTSEDVWMIHVGIERALAGSIRLLVR